MFLQSCMRRRKKEVLLLTLIFFTTYSYLVLRIARNNVHKLRSDVTMSLLEWQSDVKRNHVIIETNTLLNKQDKLLFKSQNEGENMKPPDLNFISQDLDGPAQGISRIETNVRNDEESTHSSFKDRAEVTQFSNIEVCVSAEHRNFPSCNDKLTYIRHSLEIDECFFKIHKLNASKCSIYNYLTRVEPYCPGSPELYNKEKTVVLSSELRSRKKKFLLEVLLAAKQYEWMRGRIKLLWNTWMTSLKSLNAIYSGGYTKKNVLVFFGAFTYAPDFFRYAGKGAPLGEMIQWTDLVTSLYLLGHNVSLAKTRDELNVFINQSRKEHCPSVTSKNEADVFDIIYTDIVGMWELKNKMGAGRLAKYQCKFRVLDSFGTFVEFNFPEYPYSIPGGKSAYGLLNLVPTQILTLYPHTHDNRFLGFVSFNMAAKNKTKTEFKKYSGGRPKALLYAKIAYYTKGYTEYLKIISEYFEIHATAYIHRNKHQLPPFIINHGPVEQHKIQEMLSDSKLFIGVGFPFEGPGPLEALANGVPYLQPKYAVPISKLNHKFYGSKPTLRELSSQNPYMEDFIGEPYCYTINITDEGLLRKTLQKIKDMKPLPPKIPYEFTTAGYLERVHAYTSYSDFCNPYAPRWPPANNLHVRVGQSGESCKTTCMKHGFVCERSYFDLINNRTLFQENNINCLKVRTYIVLHAPSYKIQPNICYLQAHAQVYSCMHAEKGIIRICPCRDYEKEQSAICKGCL